MNKNNAFRRGFTLIELMIVIVILGILMGTILPRLTGAQARARDTARKADLTNISQALEVYYGDTGLYPATPTLGCLDPVTDKSDADGTGAGTKSTTDVLAAYMKGGKVPAAISGQQITLGCKGSYYYKPLKSGGISQASYVLASDIETWQLANFIAGANGSKKDDASGPSTGFFNSASNASKYIAWMKPLVASDTKNTQRSIYIVIP